MIRNWLIALLSIVALTAIPSGALLVLHPDGADFQMPLTVLTGTPFADFVIPGLVLGLIVGGSALAALLAILLKRNKARQLSLLAGLMQAGWIIIQMLLLGILSNLQFLYVGIGAAIVVLAMYWKNEIQQTGIVR